MCATTTITNRATRVTNSLDALVAERQRFRCVYADPPWRYGNGGTRGAAARRGRCEGKLKQGGRTVAAVSCPGRQLTRCDMHWFWRTTIAVIVVCVYGGFASFHGPLLPAHKWLFDRVLDLTKNVPAWNRYDESLAWALAYVLPYTIIALGTFGLVSRFLGPNKRANETRCRKCNYILRGLTEPRCPECGERI